LIGLRPVGWGWPRLGFPAGCPQLTLV